MFTEYTKTASVTLHEKCKRNKNEISNFRSVSVLNIFCKVYERVFKDEIKTFFTVFFFCGLEN